MAYFKSFILEHQFMTQLSFYNRLIVIFFELVSSQQTIVYTPCISSLPPILWHWGKLKYISPHKLPELYP